jgi:hypothetical protein
MLRNANECNGMPGVTGQEEGPLISMKFVGLWLASACKFQR